MIFAMKLANHVMDPWKLIAYNAILGTILMMGHVFLLLCLHMQLFSFQSSVSASSAQSAM